MVISRESIDRTNPPVVIVTDWVTLVFFLLILFMIAILCAFIGLHWAVCPNVGQQWAGPGHPQLQPPPNVAAVGG